MGRQIAILGVALDGIPDEEDHGPGSERGPEPERGQSRKAIRARVEHAVRARGINYTVLLDPTGSAGGQFNGGELPTTVIIDAEGRVRRRFIGERSIAVFEAMITEASKPIVLSALVPEG